jgi:hypothetical protein
MPLIDDFEVQKRRSWSASQTFPLLFPARGGENNSQPHFHICALRAQSLPQLRSGSEQQSRDAASSTIFTG